MSRLSPAIMLADLLLLLGPTPVVWLLCGCCCEITERLTRRSLCRRRTGTWICVAAGGHHVGATVHSRVVLLVLLGLARVVSVGATRVLGRRRRRDLLVLLLGRRRRAKSDLWLLLLGVVRGVSLTRRNVKWRRDRGVGRVR